MRYLVWIGVVSELVCMMALGGAIAGKHVPRWAYRLVLCTIVAVALVAVVLLGVLALAFLQEEYICVSLWG